MRDFLEKAIVLQHKCRKRPKNGGGQHFSSTAYKHLIARMI
jgi:hypothetical protein